ncbi:putative 90 kDa surface protein [Trypanosoma cruzi]|nr:putative 90 kDa surface protein [Trypanosoma cruzi]
MLLQIESKFFNNESFDYDAPCVLCLVGVCTAVLLLVRVCRGGKGKEQEPQVTQLKAECTDDGNVARWQLPGKSLWYNCTDAAADFGKMICDMVAGNVPRMMLRQVLKGMRRMASSSSNTSYFTPSRMKDLWERNMEKPATVASGTSKPLEAGTLGSPEHKAPGDTSTTDPELTESGEHSSHDPPVELQEENAAAPPTQLSQTGEDGGAAGGAEGDTCFHDTRLHALPLLLLAVLAYGTLG